MAVQVGLRNATGPNLNNKLGPFILQNDTIIWIAQHDIDCGDVQGYGVVFIGQL
jgi:hypothetical protein